MTEKEKQFFLRSNYFHDEEANDIGIAFISLKTALKSFFSIYSSFSFPINPDDPTKFKRNEYYEIYTETILHLHHYFELIIKDILRKENPLLTVRLDRIDETETLLSIANGKKLDDQIISKMQTNEFGKSLNILLKLSKSEKYGKYAFFQKFETTLRLLTTLRNKIWHRGLFVLDFNSFIELVIDHILPLVLLIGNNNDYKNFDSWKPVISYKYTNLLEVLIMEKSKSKYLFLNLELGRASYHNIMREMFITQSKKDMYLLNKKTSETKKIKRGGILKDIESSLFLALYDEELAKTGMLTRIICNGNDLESEICPVCGAKALIIYAREYDDINHIEKTKKRMKVVDKIQCEMCSFTIKSDIELEDNDYDLIDYWKKDNL